MTLVYLGLGTNLGNRADNLRRAVALLQERVGHVVRQSKPYASQPWGFQSANDFLNIALAVETDLEPLALLEATQCIERDMGRQKKTVGAVYSDRIIDIDILYYGDLTIQLPNLIIPHPLIEQRDFVYIPLREIKP